MVGTELVSETPRESDAGEGLPYAGDSDIPGLDGGMASADAEAIPDADIIPDAEPPGCIPVAESCDGADEDCDERIDEGVAGCPCETLVRGDHTYMLCPMGRSWPGARLHCESYGYSLAVVQDGGEDRFLYEGIAARDFADTWIGHNDLLEEGAWVWLDGIPIVYSHWDEGEPNDGGGEDCGLIMTRHGRESEWDDRPCESERPYICEASPAP